MLIPRAEFTIEDPWSVPPGCTPIALRRATDGAAPRLATRLALFHDGECLTALFLGEDDGVHATYLRHDEPLWKEDVVELFLAPERPSRYFEIEINPLGTTFDAVIDSPDLDRATMTTDLAWTCQRLFASVRTPPASLDVVVAVPLATLGRRRSVRRQQPGVARADPGARLRAPPSERRLDRGRVGERRHGLGERPDRGAADRLCESRQRDRAERRRPLRRARSGRHRHCRP